MELDVNKQMLTINKLVDTVEKNVVIEGDLIVPDVKPDILNTIDSIGNVCVYKKEILDGKVRFDGGVYIYLMYLPDAENEFTRGLNTILDFTQIIEMENCKENMDIISDVKIKNIECKVLNGRKIKIKVELDFKIQLYSNENVNVLKEINNIENMQILNSIAIPALSGISESFITPHILSNDSSHDLRCDSEVRPKNLRYFS